MFEILEWPKKFLRLGLLSKFNPAMLMSTMCGIGFDKVAPGTLGSLVTVAIWLPLGKVLYGISGNNPLVFLLTSIMFLLLMYLTSYFAIDVYLERVQAQRELGIMATPVSSEKTKEGDPSEVIIDEFIGQVLTLVISYGSYMFLLFFYRVSSAMIFNYLGVIEMMNLGLSFIFFRAFDILKPSWVGYIDRNIKNAHGIILDDVVAGCFAGASMMCVWSIMLWFFR